MDLSEHIPRHAKLDEDGKLIETETDEGYEPKHAKPDNPWQEMADNAPEFQDDSDRQKQIVGKWNKRLEAAKPCIAYNEKAYDELVDELLYNRDAIKYGNVSEEEKSLLATRRKAAEEMLSILEESAYGYEENRREHDFEDLTDGSVILKSKVDSYNGYQESFNSTQEAYNDFLSNDPYPVYENLEQDEKDLIYEGEIRGSYRDIPEKYSNGIWDEWVELQTGEITRLSAEKTIKKLKKFLFEDKDRHIHLENRAKLVTLYNELNEYLYGEKEA